MLRHICQYLRAGSAYSSMKANMAIVESHTDMSGSVRMLYHEAFATVTAPRGDIRSMIPVSDWNSMLSYEVSGSAGASMQK